MTKVVSACTILDRTKSVIKIDRIKAKFLILKKLPLSLLMLRVFADDHDHTLSFDYLTLLTSNFN